MKALKKDNHSHISADEEQSAHLALEHSLAKKCRFVNISLAASFFAFIFVFAALFWLLPDRESSENENRALQTFPEFSLQTLSSGKFTEEFAKYMADQFPARDFFVGVKAASECAMLKGQNNGVITARGGQLISRFDSIDLETLDTNIDCVSKFAKAASSDGISVTCAFAGRTMDVMTSSLPRTYGSEASDSQLEALDEICLSHGVEYVDLVSPLRAHYENGEYVYYRTDHHWTTLGAMYAYNEIAEASFLPAVSENDFRKEAASDSFYGTTWSSAGTVWTSPDTIEFFRYDGDDMLTTSVYGGESFSGLYKREALDTKDKYSAFIGGNAARVDITSQGGEKREKILVVKDSFAHSVAPFIAKNYDVVLIDLRYYTGSLINLCRDEGINKVVILYNMDTLCSEAGFRRFRTGLGAS